MSNFTELSAIDTEEIFAKLNNLLGELPNLWGNEVFTSLEIYEKYYLELSSRDLNVNHIENHMLRILEKLEWEIYNKLAENFKKTEEIDENIEKQSYFENEAECDALLEFQSKLVRYIQSKESNQSTNKKIETINLLPYDTDNDSEYEIYDREVIQLKYFSENDEKGKKHYTLPVPGDRVIVKEHTEKIPSGTQVVIVPEGVKKIDSFSFCENDSLEYIHLPSSLEEIGEDAFYSCKKLKRIIIPNKIDWIHENTFAFCKELEYVLFSEKIEDIGNGAFAFCESLKTISFPPTLQYIGSEAFTYCEKIEALLFPKATKSIGDFAFRGCKTLRKISFEKDCMLSEIGESAFEACKKIKKVIFPSKIRNIKKKAFANTSLEMVDFPSALKHLGLGAFAGCKFLESVRFFSSINVLEGYTFACCENLKNVSICDGMTNISEFMFAECSSLKSIKIPSSVKKIGEAAFYNCSSLDSIKSSGSIEKIDKYAFVECCNLKTVEFKNLPQNLHISVFENSSYDVKKHYPNIKIYGKGMRIVGSVVKPGLKLIGKALFNHEQWND